MPLQTELHRHLDISLRPSTLLELAQQRGLEAQSTSLQTFTDKLIMRAPLADLDAVLAKFRLFQQVFYRPEIFERVAFEVVEDCYKENTRQVELRFSPSFVCELSGISWEDALKGFEAGIQKALKTFPEMKAGMICIATRELGTDTVDATIDFYLKNKKSFIGIDLAGSETNFPCKLFEASFKRAQKAGARITIHAGEAVGPENMWEALELLGAERIGHGLACVRDPLLMKHLAEKKICLEVCPTSNWITQCVPSLAEHPLPRILRAGIPVCINTDDPGVFGVSLPEEVEVCREIMGLSQDEIRKCFEYAEKASFLPH